MNGKHPLELRMQACAAYLVSGDSRQVSRLTGIPDRTIRSWFEQDWWIESTDRIRAQHEKQLDAKLTAIMDQAFTAVLDRLEHGDEVLNRDGTTVRRKVSARDAAIIGGVAYDKRALLRGQATARVERVDLDVLRKQLAQHMIDGTAETISGPDSDSEMES